jgi:uncharacterized phage infection (PIP) family protein YhgE
LIKHSIQSLGKFILLSLVFTTLLFSGGKQDVENESGNPAEQLEQFQQQLQEVEGKLKAIPQAQEKIKDLEKLMSKTLNRQKKLAKLALSLRKKCNIKKARDEINGLSYERIEKRYRTCKKGVDRLLGKNGFSHRKFMKQIAQFKETVKQHINDAEDLVNEADVLAEEKEYIKESIGHLKDQMNLGE